MARRGRQTARGRSAPAPALAPRRVEATDSRTIANRGVATLRDYGALVAIVAIAVAIRAWALGRDELWFDEAYSALVAAQGPSGILDELSRDSSPPLYFFVLHFWRSALGSGPVMLRWPSVACGLLSVVLIAKLGRVMFTSREGLIAAALLAVSPLHVHYSREVRPYSMWVLLVIASLLALEALPRRSRTAPLVAAYVLVTTCAVYTHNFSVFLLPLLAVAAVDRALPWRTALICAVLVFACYVPWIPVLAGQLAAGTAAWIARIWDQTPPPLALIKSFAVFTIGGGAPEYVTLEGRNLPSWVHAIAYVTFGALLIRALAPSADVIPAIRARRLAVMMVLVLAVPYSLSLWRPIYVVGRYDLIALPFFVLLCSRGLTQLRGRSLIVTLAVLTALSVSALASYAARSPVTGVRGQAALLVQQAGPADAVLCTGFTRNALEYYARQLGGAQRFFSFPTSFGRHRGWVDERELADVTHVAGDAAKLSAELQASVGPRDRLWIAHSRLLADANDRLMAALSARFVQVGCPARAEDVGFSCWRARSGSQ